MALFLDEEVQDPNLLKMVSVEEEEEEEAEQQHQDSPKLVLVEGVEDQQCFLVEGVVEA